ncbi:tRNA (adenosine(37)-N6)-threonylcarbamoyltransferase complex ATPase subunit type 1 TsaE [Mycoplasma sp. NEAQ87857]|uniref:tRNA (adenosine(37)-N6)-threonylcarbamoyltransferase complex ATPase subunit type 1 TsaE n=1 Tax=Mycoplasma sp. NEAQ87857 TaxID=2683967 RepID=UPI001317B6AE|nr:tRNA (adenosine(37)-N6)-threonylcarbamoyltransferase complex ATPase subunit type 1 TsaE [Mycoplasma sp. NEAQ87857]QGZ97956.1 tRNA (adenosine(37)-N6)-threonylcarbamoyltransferase complex ATPase subunit type 1 TsaE [Mycoplasma sp. NEAQ87857]
MQKEIKCNTIQELQEWVNNNFDLFNQKKIILLDGDLGAGKTTLVQLIGKKLGIKQKITSPSFSYMKTYDGLVHIDLYNYKGDLEEFEDYFEDNIVCIEWSNLKEINYANCIKIQASLLDNDFHHFEIKEII